MRNVLCIAGALLVCATGCKSVPVDDQIRVLNAAVDKFHEVGAVTQLTVEMETQSAEVYARQAFGAQLPFRLRVTGQAAARGNPAKQGEQDE